MQRINDPDRLEQLLRLFLGEQSLQGFGHL
jgi:hypothetical protein